MLVTKSNINVAPEILKRKLGGEYFGEVTINDSEFASADVVKAGSPIGADGTIQNGASAVGILLYDVYKENPNGSLIKAFAVVNEKNAKANSGLTLDGAVKTALPLVIFE